ncbi:hypothetical protein K438DRAFT_1782600 [Mycena galopus ATCC 62051]|nr:hypothetical protein K438DRAFT_1782600 [Mycena galopus ATCC 62051]
MSCQEFKRHSPRPEEPGEGGYEQPKGRPRPTERSQSSADSAEAEVYRPLPMRLGRGSADLAPECKILLAHTTDRWVTGRSRCTPVETTAVPVTGTACSPIG